MDDEQFEAAVAWIAEGFDDHPIERPTARYESCVMLRIV